MAYWSNFGSVYGQADFDLGQGLTLTAGYHHLMAMQEPTAGTSFPGGKGTTRGELLIGKLGYKINDHLSGHILWENFNPGDYYFDDADGYNWLRLEFLYRL